MEIDGRCGSCNGDALMFSIDVGLLLPSRSIDVCVCVCVALRKEKKIRMGNIICTNLNTSMLTISCQESP